MAPLKDYVKALPDIRRQLRHWVFPKTRIYKGDHIGEVDMDGLYQGLRRWNHHAVHHTPKNPLPEITMNAAEAERSCNGQGNDDKRSGSDFQTK